MIYQLTKRLKPRIFKLLEILRNTTKNKFFGVGLIALLTIIYFFPLVIRLDSYNPGGDAMFNAWTLSRNHHCILGGCDDYSNGNIFFPNQDSMLYSETQLSAGLLTLPLHFINPNPVFANNVWTILSFFFSGWFMYLLAKILSKNNELFSILAGLVFEFAPFKLVAVSHLQNLSIFYLPLAILLIIKFLDTNKKRYIIGLLTTLVLLFYASWYQMVFALLALGAFLLFGLLFKYLNFKQFIILSSVVIFACLSTLPLALEYVKFSKNNNANFGLADQQLYASRIADYGIPQSGTVEGKLVRENIVKIKKNSYNPDSVSYHGFVLYLVFVGLLILAFLKRKSKSLKTSNKQVALFGAMGLAGLIVSLGPVLQITGNPVTYIDPIHGTKVVFALPYILVDKFAPQLSFIRAIGRASIVLLFALCAIVALLPIYLNAIRRLKKYKNYMYVLVVGLIIFELMPLSLLPLSKNPYSYNLEIPHVYKYIAAQNDLDNIIILASDYAYPGLGQRSSGVPRAPVFEQILWAGYHNKNIYNGYSGYFPENYASNYDDFLDFKPDDIAKLKEKNLRYILVDKFLSSTDPDLNKNVQSILSDKVYEDDRYALYKI